MKTILSTLFSLALLAGAAQAASSISVKYNGSTTNAAPVAFTLTNVTATLGADGSLVLSNASGSFVFTNGAIAVGGTNYGTLELLNMSGTVVAGFDTNHGGFWGFGNLSGFTNLQPTFVTVTADAPDPNTRRLTAGPNVTFTDGGAGGTFQISASGGAAPSNPITLNGTNGGIMVLDANAGIAHYTTNATYFQLKTTSSNAWLTASSSNQVLAVVGQFSASGVTNTSLSAIGVVTNDAAGKEYTTPTLPSSLLKSGQAVYGGGCGIYTLPASGNYFFAPNNAFTNRTADASGVTRCVIPANGTLANLFVVASGNPGAVANTVTVMTNGVATGIVATLNNVTTGSDTTDTAPVLAGYEVGIKVSTGAGNAVSWAWGFQLR